MVVVVGVFHAGVNQFATCGIVELFQCLKRLFGNTLYEPALINGEFKQPFLSIC